MSPREPAPTPFRQRLRREALFTLAVGALGAPYVFATNTTAAPGLILLHVALFALLAPLCSATLDGLLPRAAGRPDRPADLARDVAVRLGALALSAAGMLVGVALLTGLPLAVLLARPLLTALVPVFLAYALVALLVRQARIREEALRLLEREARARQEALAARVRPHFLFNALNCIEELTDTDPVAARAAVGRLTRLLRAVLEASAAPSGCLADEVRLVDDYLGIEQIRFGDRLSYALDVHPDVSSRRLPSTVLLTLAENAVKHGVERTRGAARVELVASLLPDGRLSVTITSPAPQAAESRAEKGLGYGLRDVRERLELACGAAATLALRAEGGAARVELVLPG